MGTVSRCARAAMLRYLDASDARRNHSPRRSRRHRHQSGQGALSRKRLHQARRRPLLPRALPRRAARVRRPSQHAGPLSRTASTGNSSSRSVRPKTRPPWIEVVTHSLSFRTQRRGDRARHAADLAWMANLACLELHPHPVRAMDLDHPDELRIDLDPVADVPWSQVRDVARRREATCSSEHGLRGWPKTSGKRGLHVLVRIEPRWTHDQVRRAALALAREVERRVPALATSKWWKEERHGVFIDYNQNAKDRTVAGAYSDPSHARCARVGAARLGRGRGRASPPISRCARCRSASTSLGDPACGDRRRTRTSLDSLLELVAAPRARRPGRCAVAAAVREGRRRAARARLRRGAPLAEARVSARRRRKPSSTRKAS